MSRISVKFGEESQAFFVVDSYTFQDLLHDASHHWGIVDTATVELQTDGCSIPRKAEVNKHMDTLVKDGTVNLVSTHGHIARPGAMGGHHRRIPSVLSQAVGRQRQRSSTLVAQRGGDDPVVPAPAVASRGDGKVGQTSSPLARPASTSATPANTSSVDTTASSPDPAPRPKAASTTPSTTAKARISLMHRSHTDGHTETKRQMEDSVIVSKHAAEKNLRLVWDTPCATVLLIKKRNDASISDRARQMGEWLVKEKGIQVFVEPTVLENEVSMAQFDTYTDDDDLSTLFDLVVCIGGDGTILHLASLFPDSVPPVISFNMGSMGFMTPFDFDSFREHLTYVIEASPSISLRGRLQCTIVGPEAGEAAKTRHHVLNEVVIDRGSTPYLTNLFCYCDNQFVTHIQADGVIIATPTGSTAYSLSAFGSMVHPNVPAMLLTPICPHELTMRPLIFPDSAALRIQVPEDATFDAWTSFDGRSRQPIKPGHAVEIKMSHFPIPFIDRTNATKDWFNSLQRCLHWNSRLAQGVRDQLEEESGKSKM